MVLQPLNKHFDHNFRKSGSSQISLGLYFRKQWRCYHLETIMFLELRLSGCLPFPVATVFISVALMGKMPRLLGQFSSWMEDTNVLRRKEEMYQVSQMYQADFS